DQRRKARREREGLVQGFLKIHFLLVVIVLQDEVMEVEELAQLLGEAPRVEQILEADRAARDLVLVGRADAAPGGADLLLALGRLARMIERRVVRQDQRAG